MLHKNLTTGDIIDTLMPKIILNRDLKGFLFFIQTRSKSALFTDKNSTITLQNIQHNNKIDILDGRAYLHLTINTYRDIPN
jgi:hypothetical protein